ncbi:type III-A CRISPR-associated protein Cas10/Csm1 [Cardiobacterium valvarum]|uniref:CRISPR system single-strand-specific deoxyribonuclease Cas10/Csm1 (subtype III-A) n=1 Tax=Cardiobacterium valvarum TaxID=194702 RepID=A0A381EDY5_9GAMM|nr:type III-A CRISPR-associated protein Cas10/Csm1 [Cardiobacterium valvarum]SUX25231.1 CRISPR-associated protein Cas10/Csm1, subtype III-A/MTUBE [Cardiobacterium valvarum]
MKNVACRVAFAAFLHNLGELAERARMEATDDAPHTHPHDGHRINHPEAPPNDHTTLAWDTLKQHLPDLVRDELAPFALRTATQHHPDTFLQGIIATADRVAAGFAGDIFAQDGASHHYRLLTLFEQINLGDNPKDKTRDQLHYRYPLRPLNPHSIYPEKRENGEPADNAAAQAEYRALWQQFQHGLQHIPAVHRSNWPLWLDHFDTLWQSCTHAIPAATAFGSKPEVSLYDHSKSTAALATALWLWHDANGQTDDAAIARLRSQSDWDEEKILLIQGDFFGIQSFIFAAGRETNKKAAKLLRGRSFQVSLFAELAALRVLDTCELPPTAQILNAAGKFMIVAPNTPAMHDALARVKADINQWLLEHCYGRVALGIATHAASCRDFTAKDRFRQLIDDTFAELESAKLQRFALMGSAPTALPAAYPAGTCPYDRHLPARGSKDAPKPAALSADQITIGAELARKERLLILTPAAAVHDDGNTTTLELPIFGYHIAFTADEDISGKFGDIARRGQLLRCWDYSLPRLTDDSIWHGYARRAINAYVPRFSENDDKEKYQPLPEEERNDRPTGQVKTFNHLACEERHPDENGHYCGKIALATLKGDVDNLGKIFERGLSTPTFAKMAALSRQMNQFFSLWLPAYCAAKYPNSYTVFAGGDDFFLIGPWQQIQHLAADMRAHFREYVAANPDITFSAGIAISKPGLPLPKLSAYAEEALEKAKAHQLRDKTAKNALNLYGETVSWGDWSQLEKTAARISELERQYRLSTAYLYDLLHYTELAVAEAAGDINASIWRSRLYYRTRRYVNEQKHITAKDNAYQQLSGDLAGYIQALHGTIRIPLYNHFYQQREQ